jgi:Isochorismatase family
MGVIEIEGMMENFRCDSCCCRRCSPCGSGDYHVGGAYRVYPVFPVKRGWPGSGTAFDPASGHVRHIGPLKPRAGEPQLTKTSHNAFTTTNLQQLLTQQGITEVIVCGIRTEQCCETTARVASDLGYQVTFVTEATATSPIAHRDAPPDQTVEQLLADPRTLPAGAVIERTEYALAGRFATIATIAEVTGQAGVPAFLSGRRAS